MYTASSKNKLILSSYKFNPSMLFSRNELLKLIIPVVLETLLLQLLGMMDTIMVSYAGESAVAAVSMVDSICVLFINAFFSFGTGGAVVCGQYLGAKNSSMARRASEHLMLLIFVVSLLFSFLLLFFKSAIITFLYGSAESEVLNNCFTYYNIVIPSLPFIALYNAAAAVFRISGDSKTPLKISVLTNVVNVLGNAYMVYVLKMGVAGVAFPTLFSRGLGMFLILSLLLKNSFILNIRSLFKHKLMAKLFSDIGSIAIPNSIESALFFLGRLILVSLVTTLTTADIAANAVGNSMAPLHVFIGSGINSVLMTVVSRSVGAGDYNQARWYTGYLVRLVLIIQGLFNILLTLAIPLIVRIYNLSDYTSQLATYIQLIHGLSTAFFWPFAFMLNIAMRAAGDSKFTMWVSSFSMWFIRVFGAFISIKYFGSGVLAVWIFWILDWFLRISVFVPRFLSDKWEGKSVTNIA